MRRPTPQAKQRRDAHRSHATVVSAVVAEVVRFYRRRNGRVDEARPNTRVRCTDFSGQTRV